jgi:hypothetical protein
MSKTCVNHKETPSITMCFQCHRPICKSCTVVTPQGSFCSPECGLLHREFKEKVKVDNPASGMRRLETLLKLLISFVVVCGILYGVHLVAQRQPKLRRIDMIGRLMDVFKMRDQGRNH